MAINDKMVKINERKRKGNSFFRIGSRFQRDGLSIEQLLHLDSNCLMT